MDKRLKILQSQFDYDMQILEGLDGVLRVRVQEEIDNLRFEIETIRHSSQLHVQNAELSHNIVLAEA